MKLRNLMYATMIACAFASCSKDEENVPGGGQNDGKTTLSVKYDVPTATKAVDNTDDQINSLQMLVFSNGTLEVIGGKKEGANVAEAQVNLSDKKVMMLANVTLPAGVALGKTEAEVFTALAKAEFNESADALTMNSKLYSNITVTEEKTNCLGFASFELPSGAVNVGVPAGVTVTEKVKMYRNAAKVVLTSIKTKAGYTGEDRIPYKDPQLVVDSVYILQANQYTKLAPDAGAEYGSTEVSAGYISGGYLDGMDFTGDTYALVTGATKKDAYGVKLAGTATTSALVSPDKSFYVYENTNTSAVRDGQTLIVVSGKFSYLNQAGTRVVAPGTRYYPISIGNSSASFSETANALLALRSVAANTKGIYRNLQYNISLTVVGPGYTRPTGGSDPTMLDVQVEVVGYGEVNQDVEI